MILNVLSLKHCAHAQTSTEGLSYSITPLPPCRDRRALVVSFILKEISSFIPHPLQSMVGKLHVLPKKSKSRLSERPPHTPLCLSVALPSFYTCTVIRSVNTAWAEQSSQPNLQMTLSGNKAFSLPVSSVTHLSGGLRDQNLCLLLLSNVRAGIYLGAMSVQHRKTSADPTSMHMRWTKQVNSDTVRLKNSY